MHDIGLPASSYVLVELWSLTFPHRTDKVRMNTKIKQMPSMKLDGYSFECCQ